uniref:Uncharacterized protein n=1 Tax=Candidatus Methanophaga sp. ANME-1 ERB7 TaxID=2759913 RepID=A0A7G9Z2A7_9EURY|nr:hypothetical protein NMFEFIAP_00017 [Methanosarcinales archaeon ANME-1 ERB7]
MVKARKATIVTAADPNMAAPILDTSIVNASSGPLLSRSS